MDMKKNTIKILVKCIAFFAVLFVCIVILQHFFGIRDYSIYSREQGFLQEEENSLDAVYIGASHEFSFFQPPLAWKDHGITVFSYGIPSMPAQSYIYRVKEALKRQPDSLLILNLNSFKSMEYNDKAVHRNVDYMPWSVNKLEMMRELLSRNKYSIEKQLEFYLPLLRFHSGWSEMTSKDFTHTYNGLKGAYYYKYFLQASRPQTFDVTEESTLPDEETLSVMGRLLDYLDQEKARVLFVTVPQVIDKEHQKKLNYLEEMVRDRGYECLDMMGLGDTYGVQEAVDFHDSNHLNIHGSIKFTEYFSNYLTEHYGFTDKRGQEGLESWDTSVTLYADYIDPWTLDIERDHAKRDYDLQSPEMTVRADEEQHAVLSWTETPGADGYRIYRKTNVKGETGWKQAAETSGDTLSWTDTHTGEAARLYYTVVPFRTEEGEELFGNFSFAGAELRIS